MDVIAECIYAQIDSEGNQYQLLSEITDHRSDNSAIPIENGFTTYHNGNGVPKTTTQGWAVPPGLLERRIIQLDAFEGS